MPWDDARLHDAARRIRLLGLDVDGVLTDGGLIQFPDGAEAKRFHARDGHAIRMAQRGGLVVALISGRGLPVVANRARELKIDECHQKVSDKWPVMRDLLQRHGLTLEQAAFMGDDVVDLPLLVRVGLPLAPADAAPEVLARAAWVSARDGGHGAVAEAIRMVLGAQEVWETLLEPYTTLEEEPTS